jgi:hypothetical protein
MTADRDAPAGVSPPKERQETMTHKLVGLAVLLTIGCIDQGSPVNNTPDAPPPPPDAAPPPPDAAPEPPDAAPPVQAACVTSEFQAIDRWYGCSTLDLFNGCEMDTLYNQQTDDGTRCFDCHTAGGSDGNGAGGVLLSTNAEQTWQALRDAPGMYKYAVPVSGPSGYAGLEMNDIMIRKGLINNDGHPNYDFDGNRLEALDCFMGGMMALYTDCSNVCTNP